MTALVMMDFLSKFLGQIFNTRGSSILEAKETEKGDDDEELTKQFCRVLFIYIFTLIVVL